MIELFNTVFVHPILNVLVAFYQMFLSVGVPGAFGLAIITLTASIRLLLHPFFDQQMKTTRRMQELKPKLDILSQKHKKDPKKLQQEQMRLYKEAGINPAAGCLFFLIQMPIFIALYNTLSLFLTANTQKVVTEINNDLYFPFLKIKTIDPWFLGINLAASPSQGGQWYYYTIPFITGLIQYFQFSVTTPSTPKAKDKKQKDDKKDSADDFQRAMQTQMKYVFPVMIGWFSFSLPVGLSLYWNIFSLFSIIHYKREHSKEKMSTLDVLTH